MSLIKVRSVTDSFRRAGREFTREGVEIDTADLKKGELEKLKAEPNLVVEDVVEKKGGK